MLLTAPNARNGVQIAFALHQSLGEFSRGLPRSRQLGLRIGMAAGPVGVGTDDLFGTTPNLAARLKDKALPGQTIGSARVRDGLTDGVDADIHDLGTQEVRGLPRHRVYRFEPLANGDLAPPNPRRLLIAADAGAMKASLVVLPFDTVGGSGAAVAAGELFTDAIIAALSRGSRLRLISRLSAKALQRRPLDAVERAELVGANYVLSGRVVVRGRALDLYYELIDAATGTLLAVDMVPAGANDLLSTQSDLICKVAGAACQAILRNELELVRRQAIPNLSSYTLMLGGINLMHRFGRKDFMLAKSLLTTLTERAPRHAEPHAWLARWHVFNAVQGWSRARDRGRSKTREFSDRAMQLDPDSSIALTVAGSARIALDQDVDGGRRLYEQALRANPSEPLAWLLLGTSHSFKGEGAPAMECTRKAVALSPLDPMGFFFDTHMAAAAVADGQYGLAIELASQSLRLNCEHSSTLRTLAISQSLGGQRAAARATVQQLLGLQPELTVARFLKDSPAAPYAHGQRLAAALKRAGLPPG
jgi:TolB-like protein